MARAWRMGMARYTLSKSNQIVANASEGYPRHKPCTNVGFASALTHVQIDSVATKGHMRTHDVTYVSGARRASTELIS